ncbi:hypothetical protein J2W42_005529 [Rhizobium tibeticum]|nr:hypothetical protein [Rhizobium tibeticum]
MRVLLGGDTNAPSMMSAEKAANMIKHGVPKDVATCIHAA